MFIKVNGETEKYWVIGCLGTTLTGNTLGNRMFIFKHHAQAAIDEMLSEAGVELDYMQLHPMLVEVTAKPCSAADADTFAAEQDRWLATKGARSRRPPEQQYLLDTTPPPR
ncbi:MAG TPA: hypothetical protein PK343_13520 [Giesbergeria sp.]|nr:hypothetical protein [Giesbergeria sp.]